MRRTIAIIIVALSGFGFAACSSAGSAQQSLSYRDGYADGMSMTWSFAQPNTPQGECATYGYPPQGDDATQYFAGCTDGMTQQVFNTQHPGANS